MRTSLQPLLGQLLESHRLQLTTRYSTSAPDDVKEFLKQKQTANKQILDFMTGSPSQEEQTKIYQKANEEWRSAGELLRGQAHHLLKKAGQGKYLGGDDEPNEADFHFVTWLARIASNAGASPGAPGKDILHLISVKAEGGEIPALIGEYWDQWRQRPSFSKVGLK